VKPICPSALRAKNVSWKAIVVRELLVRHGNLSPRAIAQMLNTSLRSVNYALAELRELGDLSGVQVLALSHGNHSDHGENVAVQESAPAAQEPAPRPLTNDHPLVAALVAEGLFPGAAVNLIKTYGAERIERQLGFHAERKASGFRFRRGPAAFLYHVIVNDSPLVLPDAPGLIEAQAFKAQEAREMAAMPQALKASAGEDADKVAIAQTVVAVAAPRLALLAPVSDAAPELTRDGVITMLRLASRSGLPAVRRAAVEAASKVGLDPAQFGLRAAAV
jgi:hypothetical protein